MFGSNLAGLHGAGAAKTALKIHGAILGRGRGPQGGSYAIPTKDENLESLPLEKIERHVEKFLKYAAKNIEKRFFLTRIGCGLAGYADEQIAPFFKDAPSNVRKPEGW